MEYDGVPALACSDLRLILLLMTSAVGGAAIGGRRQGGLVGSTDVVVRQLTCCRAFLMTLICLVVTHLIETDEMAAAGGARGVEETCTQLIREGRATHTMTSYIRQVLAQVLVVTPDEARDRCSSALSTSCSSSSSTSAPCGSWLAATRASLLLSCVDLLVQHHVSVVQPSMQGFLSLLGVSACLPSATIADTYSNCAHDILCGVICALFEYVPDCRTAIATMCLSNMLSFAPKRSTASSSSHHASKKPKRSGPTIAAAEVTPAVYSFWATTQLLHRLCTSFPLLLSALSSLMEGYVPAISLLPPSVMESALEPLVLTCTYSSPLRSALLTLYRKSLLHADPDRKVFAVRSLVSLLRVVPPQTQVEIAQTLLHVLSMPLPFQSVLHECIVSIFSSTIEGTACRVSSQAAQHLLDAFVEHTDTYFSSSLYQKAVVAPLAFDPASTIRREGSHDHAIFTLRTHLGHLLHSIYCIEGCLALSDAAQHITGPSDFACLCAAVDSLLWGCSNTDQNDAIIQQGGCVSCSE